MSTENTMNVFTSSIDGLPDLAKNYLWQAVIIPETGTYLASLFDELNGTESFTYRCRTASLPERSIENTLETNWQGSKKIFPGRTKMDGEITLKFDEFQDWKVAKTIQAWMNLIYNADVDKDEGDIGTLGVVDSKTGAAASNYMSAYSCKMRLTLFSSTLESGYANDYMLYYVWPKTMSSVELDQGGSDKIEISVTFVYSTFQILNKS